MTTALTHTVRVTVRVHAGNFRKEADLSLPVTGSLGEMIEDIGYLVDAPQLSKPWRACTAGGRGLDMAQPLSATRLTDGAVIILTPQEETPAPVIRDSAEALVAAGRSAELHGLAAVWAGIGLVAVTALLAGVLPASAAVATALALGTALVIYQPASRPLVPALVFAGALAGWWAVAPPGGAGGALPPAWQAANQQLDGPALVVHSALSWVMPAALGDAAWALLAAMFCGLAMVLVFHVTAVASPRCTAAALTLGGLGLVAAGGLAMPGEAPFVAAGAAVLLAVICLIAAAPGVVTRAAGLSVPQLPTAGQDLSVSDGHQPDVDARARRAQELYAGVCLGAGLAALPALAALALTGTGITPIYDGPFGTQLNGSGFAQALCLCVGGALIMHAVRHGQASAAWCLSLLAAASLLTACLIPVVASAPASDGDPHLAMFIVAGFAAAGALSTPLWAAKVPTAEPTTIVWWERAEALAIATCLPLAAHLIGLFALLRGLG
ncbi:type VII secretion integral membrane protein EccD [Corynebacterium confusum]|uniref:type VII secretion integral membrane protein EccD n=1 Tax=Corynebacterium confusum TaxID=71254 RepID=UPI0025B2E1F7|nr:type VII secretion integral membrane protein EccD [Corynebacterium confusum]WJY88994.1 hypothetical protein CCONF_02175 [Corynebacterium confusum]